MNVAASSIPTDITVPDWLRECIVDQRSPLTGDDSDGSPGDAVLVCQAFEFAYCLHQGQYRASGEPYIAHPVAVAGLLRELGGGASMIAAGFLHDVIEDTEVTAAEIEQRFGVEVRRLVEGVTKLLSLTFLVKPSVRQKTSGGCFWPWRRIFG
jgi:GTP pyrophosphokinase